jgi:hypothetical protein
MDPAIGHQLRKGDTGHFSADRIEGTDDYRFGRVVDDQIHSSGLFEGANVTSFAADDPTLHFVVGEVDGADSVLGGMVRGDALHRREHDLASSIVRLVASGSFDRLRNADCVALGVVTDGFEELRLGLCGAHPADSLERSHVLKLSLGELLTSRFQLPFAVQKLAIALFEHVGSQIELLVASQQATLKGGQFGAFGAGFVLGLALEPQLLVLGLEYQLFLLGASLRDDPAGFVLGAPDGLIGDLAARKKAGDHAHTKGDHNCGGHKGEFHMNLPPIRPMTGPEVS